MMRTTCCVLVAAAGLCGATVVGDVAIRGRVVDAAGRPVPHALVFWVRPGPINSYPPSIDGQTDQRGQFELLLKGPEQTKDVLLDNVIVYGEGHGLAVTNVAALSKAEDPGPVTISLPAETNTGFRIVDPDGHVLGGELVEPVIYTEGSVAKLPATFVQAVGRVTDDAGYVRFPALTNLKLRTIRVVSQTFGPQQIERRSSEAMAESTMILRPAGRVEVVFDTASGAMGKCKILAFTTPPPVNRDPAAIEIMQGSLQGAYAEFFENPRKFEIPALAAGVLRFQLSGCTNQEAVLPHWPEKTELKAGETKSFVVPFEKTVTIRGRVLENVTGKPCSNADVFVYTRNAGCSILTRTDEEGRYTCNVLQGPVSAYATRPFGPGHPSMQRSSFQESVAGPDGYEFPDAKLPEQVMPGS